MTEQTQPTDAEIDLLISKHWPAFATVGAFPLKALRNAFREGIFEWGTPAGAGQPLTDSYVQMVPDKCDRIVWRNHYYHLPPAPQPTQAHIEKCAVCGDGNARLLVMRNCDVCGSDYAGQSESEVNVALERARRATQAQAGAVPLTFEQARAIREGELNASSEGYFGARSKLDTNRNHNLFKAGFERGWDAREDLYAKE